jgi:hypothetical protein
MCAVASRYRDNVHTVTTGDLPEFSRYGNLEIWEKSAEFVVPERKNCGLIKTPDATLRCKNLMGRNKFKGRN